MGRRLISAVFAGLLGLLLLPAAARSEGPPLTVPKVKLAAALTCSPDVADAGRKPVLLTPAFSSDQTSYGWNYLARLPRIPIPHCSISVEDEGYGDLQLTSQYVVYAVRRMRAMSGRKVILFGHQHGALDELSALKFWPDVARSVSDLVSLATPYNGTISSASLCSSPSGCAPATWQISAGSSFLAALAAAPLPRGPSYTSITSLDDTLITPQPEASRLPGASNVVLQEICPGRQVSHFEILADNVAYELFLDAISHPGPADPSRIPAGACDQRLMPDADPAVLAVADAFLGIFIVRNVELGVPAEPAAAGYTQRKGPELAILTRSTQVNRGGRVRIRVRCRSVATTFCRTGLTLRTRRGAKVGTGRVEVGPEQARNLSVRLGRRALRRIQNRGRIRLRARLTGLDALANRASVARRVTLEN